MKAMGLLEKIPNSRITNAWLNTQMFEATPFRTVFRQGSLKVKIYDSFESPARAQVLLFPSLINRPYILDLGRGRSLIQALVKSGIEVVMFDWGSPGETERDLGLHGLMEMRIPDALKAVHAYSEFSEDDARPRTLMGHCLGGNLALLFAGSLTKKRSPLRIDRIVSLTTPIDTKNSALLNTWFQIPNWNPERFAQSFETIPWPILQLGFQMLRPTMTPRRWIQFAGRLRDRDYRESWLQMEIWSNDNVSFSCELFKDLLIPMYRDNGMLGHLNVDYAIKDIRVPIFSIAATDDHIVQLDGARAIRKAVPEAEHTFIEARGGHVGAVISKRTRETVWPEMLEFIYRRADDSSVDSSRKAYRIDQELRANPSQKSAVTNDEVSVPEELLGLKESAGNSGARQSSAQVQT